MTERLATHSGWVGGRLRASADRLLGDVEVGPGVEEAVGAVVSASGVTRRGDDQIPAGVLVGPKGSPRLGSLPRTAVTHMNLDLLLVRMGE